MKRAPVLFFSILTYAVFDPGALRAASDPRATQLTYESWTKYCLGDSNCFIGAGARGACFPSGGGLSIQVTGAKDATLSAHFATRRALEGAIGVQIDQGDPILIPHPECTGFYCGGNAQVDSDFIERLKRSQTITIEATDTNHQRNSLTLSLADFAKAYDGPEAPSPRVYEDTQENLRKELAKREEEQKKLECQE
jgi:invasion protein IalB